MRRTIGLLVVLALAAGLWWKREDATRLAWEHLPFARAYLDPGAATRNLAAAPASSRPTPPRVPVVVAAAQKKSLPITVDAVGTVQSAASVPVKPRIDSQIDTVEVAEGAHVKQGDLLFTLDSRALKAQLAQADAQIDKDRVQIDQSRRDLARAEDLLAKRISTEVQRDTANTALKTLQAQLASDQAQRANLAALLSYTEIRSPVTGRIGSIPMKTGTTVRAADAQALATVNQIDPIYVSFAVPQVYFPELRKALAGGKVRVDVRVGTQTLSGAVAFVENTVDLTTGTILVKANVPNKEELLWPGAFVSAQVLLGQQEDAISVPSSAVQIGQQGSYLFVIRENGTAEMRKVTVARTIGQTSVIGTGLAGGEQVVVDGQLRLVDGAAVQVQQSRTEGLAKTNPTEDVQNASARRG
jgi:multidrug efflux system membrane fusion protein